MPDAHSCCPSLSPMPIFVRGPYPLRSRMYPFALACPLAQPLLYVGDMEGVNMDDITRNAIAAAYYDFVKADEIWSTELRKAFGKQAGDKRYTVEGAALPGQAGFVATGDRWRKLVEATRLYK